MVSAQSTFDGPVAGVKIDGASRIVAVWGHPVSHSRSPVMQNAAIAELGLNWVYVPFDIAPERTRDAVLGLRALGFVGANCTVPLKELVGPYLDVVDEHARRIGSVNTIVRSESGELSGFSTDGDGLVWDLKRHGIAVSGRKILIWGAGGSARAVACALAGDAQVTVANRTLERASAVAELAGAAAVPLYGSEYERAIAEADLLINTTVVGMGDDSMLPMPNGYPRPGQSVYDLVYAPAVTPLLARARQAGCGAVNGLGMLACQGALSLALWTGRSPLEMPLATMLAALGQA